MEPKISIITSIYKGEKYLIRFLDSVKEQTALRNCELIVILNEGTKEEKKILNAFEKENALDCNYVFLEEKESLGASWNRAISLARGQYISFWNVDDIRNPDSLENQFNDLEDHPEFFISYGDFIEVIDTSSTKGSRFYTPEFNRSIFSRRFACGGAFLFFRSNIFHEHGYFDEQFKIASDFEYVMRLIYFKKTFCKTKGLLGLFLNNNSGLSTQPNHDISEIERNVIYKRYGILDKIKPEFVSGMGIYEIDNCIFFGKSISIQELNIDLNKNIKMSFQKLVTYKIKNIIRICLIKFGLWEKSIVVRDRLFGYKKEK